MTHYPEALDSWWLEQASSYYFSSSTHTTIKRLASAAEVLSDVFTSDRDEDFSGYAMDTEAVLAYGCYFFPQTFARINYVINELIKFRHWNPNSPEPLRILDLGCGLGAASFALAYRLSRHFTTGVLIDAVDQSRVQLDLLKKCATAHRTLWPQTRWITHMGDARNILESHKFPSQNLWDIIIASFSLGEFFYKAPHEKATSWLDTILSHLKKEGICLLIEPALSETAIRLEKLHDYLINRDFKIWGPCLHQSACPMLSKYGEKHWCHEVHLWQPPQTLLDINKNLDKPRIVKELKFSYLAFGHEASPLPEGDLGRMVSPVVETAGKLQMSICSSNGLLEHHDLLTRGFKAKDKKRVKKLSRGDLLSIHAKEPLKGENSFRIKNKDSYKTIYQHDH